MAAGSEPVPATAYGYLVRARIPCADLGALQVKGRVKWREGWLVVRRVNDIRGDVYQIDWQDMNGRPKVVSNQIDAMALSLRAGQLICRAVLLKMNPMYRPGMNVT